MDWSAFALSLKLASATSAILLPLGLMLGRVLAWKRFRGKGVAEALLALPLVLPPIVLGYFLLVAFGGASPLGRAWQALTGGTLVFTFSGLLIASLIVNLPFAVQPITRALAAIDPEIREAAWVSGLSRGAALWRIELPLAWPGVLQALALCFAHTLGEFGVVLMVGGNIPGETRTISLAIYDRAQAFDAHGAATMSLVLLGFSLAALVAAQLLTGRIGSRHEG
uniref:Molybdenum transport system permease n=1 Tax=Acidicaldus sp. TaxID=1872105 RepID=A0A8J4HA64_9PROT